MREQPKIYDNVQTGCCVELELVHRSGEREKLQFDVVPDHQSDYRAGFLGVGSPIGQAILGESPGILIPFFTDELLGVEILSITATTRIAPSDASKRREENLRETKNQIEFRNAVLFAASTATKWGGYDADGLDYEGWKLGQSKSEDQNADE